MKQVKLIDDTTEQRKKKLKTAISIEKRKNDLFQYKDTEGMKEHVVLLSGFFLEAEKEFPQACFGLSITKKPIKGDKEYKPQFIKLRKEEDVKRLTLDTIPISGMTAFLLFGYYDAINNKDMSLFKLKVDTFLNSLEQRYIKENVIKFTKEVWKQFFEYVYNHNSIGASEAKNIFEIKLKEHKLWR